MKGIVKKALLAAVCLSASGVYAADYGFVSRFFQAPVSLARKTTNMVCNSTVMLKQAIRNHTQKVYSFVRQHPYACGAGAFVALAAYAFGVRYFGAPKNEVEDVDLNNEIVVTLPNGVQVSAGEPTEPEYQTDFPTRNPFGVLGEVTLK